MQKHTVRTILIWAAIALSIVYIYPTIGWSTLTPEQRQARIDKWKKEDQVYHAPNIFAELWRGAKRWAEFDNNRIINLGLDLKGGVHMVIGLRPEGKKVRDLTEADWKKLEERFPDLQGNRDEILRRVQDIALQRIRLRVAEFEAQEPLIQAMGTDQIQVQLPGEQDVSRAQNLIKKSAFLTFNIASNGAETKQVFRKIEEQFPKRFLPFMKTERGQFVVPAQGFEQVRQTLEEATKVEGLIPEDKLILFGPAPRAELGEANYEIYLIAKEPIMTGEGLASAHARPNPEQQPDWMILFQWRPAEAQKFYEATKANLKRPMAIVLDNVVLSAPTIQQAIFESGQITGSFQREQAQDLAIALNSGAMPVPVEEEYAGIVGATLGSDSIRHGMISGLIGLAFILVIVPIYYRLGGIITDIALLLNALMLLASMAYLHATLTLPGIAGLILSIAMAVDTNVLVFERMREERRKGHSLLATIDAGYKRATVTVLDSNITTLISSAVLMQFGTGPIQGFAVALCIGIIVSLFTSLTCTRAMYDWLTARDKIKELNFMQAIKPDTNIHFMDKRFICFALSAIVIAIGASGFLYRQIYGPSNFGVDFTTGTNMTVDIQAPEAVDVGKVRDALTSGGFNDVRVQEASGTVGSTSSRFLVHLSEIAGDDQKAAPAGNAPAEGAPAAAVKTTDTAAISKRVQEALAPLAGGDSNKVVNEGVTMVGPAVGETLIRDAVWAVVYSVLFIIAYLWFRFELVFALGAAIALMHDVFITMGLFALSGQQISMASVAAILTVIGYSLNDTIVVFDRIREDKAVYRGKGMTYLEIMDRSINETLSRTLLTAVTTIIVIVVLYFFGGDVLRDFSFILLMGIVFGTYSSVYVASPIAYYLDRYYERYVRGRIHSEKTEVGSRRRPQRKTASGEEEATV